MPVRYTRLRAGFYLSEDGEIMIQRERMPNSRAYRWVVRMAEGYDMREFVACKSLKLARAWVERWGSDYWGAAFWG